MKTDSVNFACTHGRDSACQSAAENRVTSLFPLDPFRESPDQPCGRQGFLNGAIAQLFVPFVGRSPPCNPRIAPLRRRQRASVVDATNRNTDRRRRRARPASGPLGMSLRKRDPDHEMHSFLKNRCKKRTSASACLFRNDWILSGRIDPQNDGMRTISPTSRRATSSVVREWRATDTPSRVRRAIQPRGDQ